MSYANDLVINVSNIIGQLQDTQFEDLANAAQDLASKAKLPQKVLEIFSTFEKDLRRLEGEDHHISDRLHTLLSDERKRIAQAWRKRLRPREGRVENQEYQPPLRKRARAEAPAGPVKADNVAEARIQQPCKDGRSRKRGRSEMDQPLPLHISDLPSPAIEEIFKWLPNDDKARLFEAAAPKQTENVREAALPEVVFNLPPLLADSEIRELYEVVYGESLPPPGLAQKRDEAKRRGDTQAVHQIDAQIGKANRTPKYLMEEWSVLPVDVRALFGNFDASKILDNPDSCKSVLRAIRAYNLVCVGKKVFRDFVPDLATQKGWIEAGETVAKRLHEEGGSLTELGLRCARLTCLPLEVTRLKNLQELILDYNDLSVLPPQIGNLSHLTCLSLLNNCLTSLPPEIGNLSKLIKLYTPYNCLITLPREIGDLISLESLNLSRNKLTSLPPEIGKLSKLDRLGMSYNCLTSLPPEIGNLVSLTDLNLEASGLTSLPSEIGSLPVLTALDVSHNKLTTLPGEIWNLVSMTDLDLSCNCLATLPSEIEKLTSLDYLDLSYNSFTTLPREIGKLTSLDHLDLSYNGLATLPPEIGNLSHLTSLAVIRNCLTSMPSEIWKLSKRTKLYIGGNQIPSWPNEMIDKTNIVWES